jgi:hypothetical protein
MKLLPSFLVWLVAIAILATGSVTRAQPVSPSQRSTPAGGSESLGDQLLNDLGPAALPPADRQHEPARPNGGANPNLRFNPPTRFDDLGEDLGAPSGPLPLVRARQGMQQAGALLAQHANVTEVRAAQQQVVAQLDELINGLCKQCQGGGQSSPKPPQPGQRSQPKVAKGGAKPGMSAIAPRESTDEPQPPADGQAKLADREALIKQLWGHLPERSREQMLQSFSGEFLPKYELELEKYYRRLAEEEARQD